MFVGNRATGRRESAPSPAIAKDSSLTVHLGPQATTFDLSEAPPAPSTLHPKFERSVRALRRQLEASKAEHAAAADGACSHRLWSSRTDPG